MDEVWTHMRHSGSLSEEADGQPSSTKSNDLARLTVSNFFLNVGIQDLPPNNPLSQAGTLRLILPTARLLAVRCSALSRKTAPWSGT